jgi:hypothetical protein
MLPLRFPICVGMTPLSPAGFFTIGRWAPAPAVAAAKLRVQAAIAIAIFFHIVVLLAAKPGREPRESNPRADPAGR